VTAFMIRFRLPGWCIAIAVFLAATFTICAIAKMAIDLMAEDSHAPWLLYLLWFLLLAMFWSGLSLLRWRSNLAIVTLRTRRSSSLLDLRNAPRPVHPHFPHG
jgi:hypothetical protein